ncbi:MAG: polysaccharide biosynthesis protein [Clostridia bacterium]|nr:polysaccharide biosynthesis protein [Clostridia bacterium]
MKFNQRFLSNLHRFFLPLLDLGVAFCAYVLSELIWEKKAEVPLTVWSHLPSVLFCVAAFFAVFYFFPVHRTIWRYAQAPEYIQCSLASLVATAFYAVLDLIFGNCALHSFGFYVFFGLFALVGALGLRLIYRVVSGGLWRAAAGKRRRTLLVGAGEAAMALIAESRENVNCDFVVVAAVDDDPSKVGRRLGGVPICGSTADIPSVAKAYRAEYIIVAIPSVGNQKRAEILDICSELGILVRMLPRVADLPEERDAHRIFKSLREIDPDELLGREPVDLTDERVIDFLSGKRVLVTGGGGSIGSELCRQIASMGVSRLTIFDIYENNAYEIEQELRRTYGDRLDLHVLIGSVRDYARLSQVFEAERPQIVFHAAAHKHVPLMEFSPQEAVKNNVFGTLNTARASIAHKVEKFILISTDKAVNPTNVMGATKRLCEMIVQSFANTSSTQFAAVRFGNVLGSNGSVIPLFKRQIAAGGPVTVTDPEIIRYFMTIPEASQLVLTAAAMAKGGEIFVLDMGNPVKIVDLAKKMIQLSGLREGRDIEIRYTGLRPGEKLYEELLMSEEGMKKTENAKIFIGQPILIDREKFLQDLKDLSELVRSGDPKARDVVRLLARAVDTYHPKGIGENA